MYFFQNLAEGSNFSLASSIQWWPFSLWGKENFNKFLWIVAEYPNIEIRKMGKIKYSKFEALHLRYFLPKVILNLRTVKPHIKVEETEGGERRVTNLDKITDIFVRHYLLVIWRPFNSGNKNSVYEPWTGMESPGCRTGPPSPERSPEFAETVAGSRRFLECFRTERLFLC